MNRQYAPYAKVPRTQEWNRNAFRWSRIALGALVDIVVVAMLASVLFR